MDWWIDETPPHPLDTEDLGWLETERFQIQVTRAEFDSYNIGEWYQKSDMILGLVVGRHTEVGTSMTVGGAPAFFLMLQITSSVDWEKPDPIFNFSLGNFNSC